MGMLHEVDPEVAEAIAAEEHRQRDDLELIASENYTSAAVCEAVGSVLTNKYAEGLPGKRYYGGCGHVDTVERLAIDRAKELFGADHVNVQPHSGASANQAVYYACLEPGDTVLAMDLAHGGHLTHGMKLNYSGRWYPTISYGLTAETGRLDYDDIAAQGPRAPAQADPRRGQRVFPRHRLRADRRGRPRGRRHLLRRHGPHRRPGRRRRPPQPGRPGRLRHDHHAQDLARPARRDRHVHRQWAKKLDSAVFPGLQGGPLMHVIAGKAVCLGEALRPEFKATPSRSSPTPGP